MAEREHGTSDALPAWLTAMEVVAWIVARDPTIVHLASLETLRSSETLVKYDLPSRGGITYSLAEIFGRPGKSTPGSVTTRHIVKPPSKNC